MRDDDRAPLERALAQPLIRLVDPIERKPLHVRADHAPPGSTPYFAAGVVAGWVIYLFVAWVLWRWARRRFLRACELSRGSAPGTVPPVVDEPAAAPR